MLNPLRFHKHLTDPGQDSFMERLSEKVADGMGTVKFLIISTLIIVAWMVTNHLATFLHTAYEGLRNGTGFDPAPYILLNLMFSAVAFYTGALVIIAQKAQTKRDKLNEAAAAAHRDEINRQMQDSLAAQTELLQDNTLLTQQVKSLTEEVHALALGNKPIVALPPVSGNESI